MVGIPKHLKLPPASFIRVEKYDGRCISEILVSLYQTV
jgi:hypothetical protein